MHSYEASIIMKSQLNNIYSVILSIFLCDVFNEFYFSEQI